MSIVLIVINGYWWLLMAIILVVIGDYSIGGYWWLLMVILYIKATMVVSVCVGNAWKILPVTARSLWSFPRCN